MKPMRALAGTIMAMSLAFAIPSSVAAADPLNGPCNTLQLNNNSWVVRTVDTTQQQGWVSSVQGSISRYDYLLCSYFAIAPNVSSSAAWVAIEGSAASDDIVQDGYIKCQRGCINFFPINELDYFWAAGQSGDLTHLPWPVRIGAADTSSSHVFTTQLRLVNGAYQWQFLIDGIVRATTDDSWRKWNRDRVQVGTEVWNCGDQMGGRTASGTDPGNKQKFRNIVWVNATSHSGGLGASQHLGNSYPWAFSSDINTSDFDVWTSAHTSGNCSG